MEREIYRGVTSRFSAYPGESSPEPSDFSPIFHDSPEVQLRPTPAEVVRNQYAGLAIPNDPHLSFGAVGSTRTALQPDISIFAATRSMRRSPSIESIEFSPSLCYPLETGSSYQSRSPSPPPLEPLFPHDVRLDQTFPDENRVLNEDPDVSRSSTPPIEPHENTMDSSHANSEELVSHRSPPSNDNSPATRSICGGVILVHTSARPLPCTILPSSGMYGADSLSGTDHAPTQQGQFYNGNVAPTNGLLSPQPVPPAHSLNDSITHGQSEGELRGGEATAPESDPTGSTLPCPGNLLGVAKKGDLTKYVCLYISPLRPHSGPCGEHFVCENKRNWTRHLATVHGKEEDEALQDGLLEESQLIAMKDPDCKKQEYTCMRTDCPYIAQHGRQWYVGEWGRIDRARGKHLKEYHADEIHKRKSRITPRKKPSKAKSAVEGPLFSQAALQPFLQPSASVVSGSGDPASGSGSHASGSRKRSRSQGGETTKRKRVKRS